MLNPLAICRVSRQFHYVAFTTPQLWQCVRLSRIPRLPQIWQRVLRLYLNNSGGLSLAFHFSGDTCMDMFLSEELRMDRGEIETPTCHSTQLAHLTHHGFNAEISQVLSVSRSLCSLSLGDINGTSWGNFILKAIWAQGSFPQLETLDLKFKYNWPNPSLQLGGTTQQLPNLWSLTLDSIPLQPRDYQKVIESCQNIKYLQVELGTPRPPFFDVTPSAIFLPKLEEFVLLHRLNRPFFSIIAPKLTKASFTSPQGGPTVPFHHLSVSTQPPSNLVTLEICSGVPQTDHILQFLRTPAISAALRALKFRSATAEGSRYIFALLKVLESDLELCPGLCTIDFERGPFRLRKSNGRAKKVMERAVLPMIRARKRAGMDLRVT